MVTGKVNLKIFITKAADRSDTLNAKNLRNITATYCRRLEQKLMSTFFDIYAEYMIPDCLTTTVVIIPSTDH